MNPIYSLLTSIEVEAEKLSPHIRGIILDQVDKMYATLRQIDEEDTTEQAREDDKHTEEHTNQVIDSHFAPSEGF